MIFQVKNSLNVKGGQSAAYMYIVRYLIIVNSDQTNFIILFFFAVLQAI